MNAQTVAMDPDPVAEAKAVEPFEAFYRAYADRVYRALAVTLGDPQLAQDAADEAMARAYANWAKVQRLDNPGGWAYRVGLNWATSWWRKRRRELALLHADRGRWVSPPDPAATAAHAALATLAIPMRTVVVCRVLLDLSTADTAAVLGIAEGTVKSRLARSLATLRAILTESTMDKDPIDEDPDEDTMDEEQT